MARKKRTTDSYDGVFPLRLTKQLDYIGMTQAALAAKLGVTRQAVSEYCRGVSSPSWEGIAMIAQCLDCSADYLLGLSELKAKKTEETTLADLGLSDKASTKLELMAIFLGVESDGEDDVHKDIEKEKSMAKMTADGLSALLESPYCDFVLHDIVRIRELVGYEKATLSDYDDLAFMHVEGHPTWIVLDGHAACRYHLQNSERGFRRMMEQITGYKELEKLTEEQMEKRAKDTNIVEVGHDGIHTQEDHKDGKDIL